MFHASWLSHRFLNIVNLLSCMSMNFSICSSFLLLIGKLGFDFMAFFYFFTFWISKFYAGLILIILPFVLKSFTLWWFCLWSLAKGVVTVFTIAKLCATLFVFQAITSNNWGIFKNNFVTVGSILFVIFSTATSFMLLDTRIICSLFYYTIIMPWSKLCKSN